MTGRAVPAPRRLLLPLLVLAAVLLPAGPAAAHTRLAGTSPATGAVVPAGTAEVVLTFTDTVREDLSTVVVTGPGGAAGARGPAVTRGSDVVQALAAPLAAGAWTVAYRVVAADGHPITGTLEVAVAAPAVQPGAAPAGRPSPLAAVDPAGTTRDDSPSLLLPALGVLLVAGGAAGLLRRRRLTPRR